MKFIIFDFKAHNHLIDSFLEAASLSHKIAKQNRKWFHWKFKDYPGDGVILSCAVKNEQVIGCVGFYPQYIQNNADCIKAYISCETFVHPKYQGRGLFSKLLELAEIEIEANDGVICLNFPNSASLSGFVKKGWIKNNLLEYKIKILKPLQILIRLKNLKKPFISQPSNFKEIKNSHIPELSNYRAGVYPIYTPEYINWRFLSHPNGHYHIINDNNCFSIIRLGYRGDIFEAQILYVYPTDRSIFSMKKYINKIKIEINPDIVSLSITKNSFLHREATRRLFFKVPSSGNSCYKLIDDSIKFNISTIDYERIIAHTY